MKIVLYICPNLNEIIIKNYFYIILFAVCLSSVGAFSQDNKQAKAQENPIEGLSVYPNPVSGDRIYITTKFNDDKEVIIYDVLGKKSTSNHHDIKRIEH